MEIYRGTPKKLNQILYDLDSNKIYELKEYKEKRSKDQNAYAWELITQIGNALRLSKEEVYLQMLKDYGQSEDALLIDGANPKGYAKYDELLGRRNMENGKLFNVYRLYKGSSEFNKEEMSIFIDGVVQEAKELGIDTRTYDEIKRDEMYEIT